MLVNKYNEVDNFNFNFITDNNQYQNSTNAHSYQFDPKLSSLKYFEDIVTVKVNSSKSDPTRTQTNYSRSANIGCSVCRHSSVWHIVMRIWSQCSTNFISFIGKARRKDKDVSAVTPSQEESKQYLHAAMLQCTTPEDKLREIVNLPEGLDYNEWLASHTLAFFDHINLLYGTISEFCSMSGCPDMTGPCNRSYLWIDEKGKRCKVAAPQYIDYVMTFTQKTVNDENIFPTKFDKEFPTSFESIVKKIIKLLYHVLAHIYHSHFKEIVLLSLHSHLNCIFAHLVLFNDKFKLIEEKEVEVLHDLAIALKLFPPLASETSNDSLGTETDQNFVSSAIIDNNNEVITTQCRSISPLVEANNSKCIKLIENERNLIKSDDNSVALSALEVPFNSNTDQFNKLIAETSQSFSDKNNRRSISASAILLSSSDPSIPTTISRRCNSDRTTGRTTASTIYHRFEHHHNLHSNRASILPMNTTAPLFAACGSSSFKFQ